MSMSSTRGNRVAARRLVSIAVWSQPALKAIDYKGRVRWSHVYPGHGGGISGLLTTAGKLLFGGDPSGHFVAYAPETGRILWHTGLGSTISNGPMTYELDGRQYVLAAAGDNLCALLPNR